MLSYAILKQTTINFFKNGYYFDYLLKQFSQLFVYNVYIYLAYFFAEKYLIEFNTKFIFNYFSYLFYRHVFATHQLRLFIYTILILLNFILILV